MLFEKAVELYIDDKAKRLRACTLEGYRSALRCHLHPRWDGVELESIAPEDVQAWVDGFDLPGAAEKAYKTLRQVIRWAIRRLGVRMYDPTAAGVELPRKVAHRPRTMEAGQVRGYLRALWGHECEAVAICSVTLGLRRGEACGLKWSDIDLRTGEVRIRRSRQVVHGHEVVEAPKTERSARSCTVADAGRAHVDDSPRGYGILCALPAHYAGNLPGPGKAGAAHVRRIDLSRRLHPDGKAVGAVVVRQVRHHAHLVARPESARHGAYLVRSPRTGEGHGDRVQLHDHYGAEAA